MEEFKCLWNKASKIAYGGAARKNNLKEAPNYQNFNLGSLNISPAIGLNQINNSHYSGINISLNL